MNQEHRTSDSAHATSYEAGMYCRDKVVRTTTYIGHTVYDNAAYFAGAAKFGAQSVKGFVQGFFRTKG